MTAQKTALFLFGFFVLTSVTGNSAPQKRGAQLTKWAIDSDHAAAEFKVRHLGISNVRGSFHGIKGEVVGDEADISQTKVNATIDVRTLDTGIEKRDHHLKSPDFFDVEKFPLMKFESTKMSRKADGKIEMRGKLTIHGVTKDVVLAVEEPTAAIKNPAGKISRGLSATTTINRKDFGLMWDKVTEGVSVVGDMITIGLDIELVKQD